MKKSISLITASLVLGMCGAFFIPVYAEERLAQETTIPEITDEVIKSEFITSETVNLPSAVTNSSETEKSDVKVTNVPDGSGTLVEDISDNETNRQFITVQSKGGHTFYIIIEKGKNGDNVYFLNAVDDFDLLSFSENFPDGVLEAYEEFKEEAAANEINTDNSVESENSETPVKPVKINNPDNSENTESTTAANNTQMYVLIGVGVLFIGGFVYFKLIKGKDKSKSKPVKENDFDEDEEESEGEV